MKKILRFIWRHKIISSIILIALIAVPFLITPANSAQVETMIINKADISQTVLASGKIKSKQQLKVSFLAGGKIVYVGAREGEFVKKWQTLASLDSRSVQKNIQDDLIDYMKQRNSFEDTTENYQNRTPAQALNEDMKRILQNNQYDLDKSVISVEMQSLAKEQSYISSPIDGIIIGSDITASGINAPAGSGFTIADPDNIIFNIEVDEADIGKIRLGMPVKVMLESFPDDVLNLRVTNIDFSSHTSSNGSNVFDVEVAFPDNAGYIYKIGMSGDGEIILSERESVVTIPLSSIFDQNHVYIKKNDTYIKRKLVLGIQSDTEREVISGLAQGDEVVLVPEEVELMMDNKKNFYFF